MFPLYWNAQRKADALFIAQTPEIEREITRFSNFRVDRPHLWPEPVPGNGWDSYTKAFATFPTLPPSVLNTGNMWMEIKPPKSLDEAKLLLKELQPVLNFLRRAQQADHLEIHRRYLYYRQWDMGWNSAQQGTLQRCLLKVAASLHSWGEDADALDLHLLLLGTTLDLLQGTSLMYQHPEYPNQSVFAFKGVLSQSSLSDVDLRKAAVFVERLAATRSTLLDRLAAEEASLRMATLDSERNNRDFFVWEQNPPWTFFWSPRLVRAAALVQLKQSYSDLAQVAKGPASEWDRAATAIVQDAQFRLIHATQEQTTLEAFAKESWLRNGLRFLRTALAIAEFQAKLKRDPETLEELVPGFLSELPREELSGDVLNYEAGKLWTRQTSKRPWVIGRRS